MTLAEPLRHAQVAVATWSPRRRASVHLEGGLLRHLATRGDDHVIGRYVAWIDRTSGRGHPVSPPAPTTASARSSAAAHRRMRL